ncbi:MAG: urea ABC transporter ATP-binding protein UrtD [Oscillospiraceae bacterium]|jgi:urea transport system ATP-binding protein|nr:urea ABC transporter ATP-binding protein UrtD [Oscillospiraceae bacterium]
MERSEALLELIGVSVDFRGFRAVDGVSLSIREGEIRTIIGPNGAGKSTLIDLITAKTRVKAGRVLFNGRDITNRPPDEIANLHGIGRKFQGPNVFDDMTVSENIMLALRGYHRIWGNIFYKATEETQARIHDILRRIGLYEKRAERTAYLSHGEKQWVEIGMVLAQDAKLIILDEPTTGMTADETRKTGEMIQEMSGEHTIIVSEHDMDFVRQIARTVTVMNQGQILAEGTFEEIQNNPEVIRVYLKQDTDSGTGR